MVAGAAICCAAAVGLLLEGTEIGRTAKRVCAALLLGASVVYAVPHSVAGLREYLRSGTQSLKRALVRTAVTVTWIVSGIVFLVVAADPWLQLSVSLVLFQTVWLIERGNEGYALAGAMFVLLTLVGFNLPATLASLTGGPETRDPRSPPGPSDEDGTATEKPRPLPPLDYDRPIGEPRRLGEEATYEERCRDARTRKGERLPIAPGAGAPEDVDDQLYRLWLGEHDVEDGEGQLAAGCAQLAQPRRRPIRMWVAIGWCGEELRSVGIAPRRKNAALFIFRAARLARDLINAGKLLGGSSRTPVLTGEFFVLRSVDGPYVVVRDERGEEGAPSGESSCTDYRPGNRFTVVPPGLLRHWRRVAEDAWAWPEPDLGSNAKTRRGARFRFTDDGTGEEAATAWCEQDTQCTMRFEGRTYRPRRPGRGTLKHLLALAR